MKMLMRFFKNFSKQTLWAITFLVGRPTGSMEDFLSADQIICLFGAPSLLCGDALIAVL